MRTVSNIGLGLAALGRPDYINIRDGSAIDKSATAFRENAFAVLDFAYARGVRYFDTAPSYGKGETFLLEWYQQRQPEDVFLATKWGYTYKADWQIGYTGKHEVKEHSLQRLLEQWQVSRQLLPALRLYQVHSATFESGVLENSEVHRQLFEIKERTGVLMGITTSGVDQRDVIKMALDIHVGGKPLFDAFQATYNILDRSTTSVLETAKKVGKRIIVKEALANGRLFPNARYPHYAGLYTKLQQIAHTHKVGIDAVALRFVMDLISPHMVLSGAASVNQLQENLKAMNFQLSKEELALLGREKVSSRDYWNERQSLEWN